MTYSAMSLATALTITGDSYENFQCGLWHTLVSDAAGTVRLFL